MLGHQNVIQSGYSKCTDIENYHNIYYPVEKDGIIRSSIVSNVFASNLAEKFPNDIFKVDGIIFGSNLSCAHYVLKINEENRSWFRGNDQKLVEIGFNNGKLSALIFNSSIKEDIVKVIEELNSSYNLQMNKLLYIE